jgi:hypothetical protein
VARLSYRMLFATLLAAAGCSSSTPPPAAPAVPVKFMGSLKYEVGLELPPNTFVGLTDGFSGTAEGRSIEFKGGTLRIDGKSYGAMAQGDRVKVEESGKVLVNDQVRPPKAGE